MKYTVKEFSDKFLSFVGDDSLDLNEPFLINAINWSFNELPRVPKLDKIFSKHLTANLDAKEHYKWNLNQDFRRINNIPYLGFLSSKGGKPCPIKICHKGVVDFYRRNGLPELRQPGTPCEYTIEYESDDVWLVMDRPLDIPIIVDYIAYGYPKPVTSMDDEIDISAIAENLMLGLMRTVMYYEGADFGFGEATVQYLDNKAVREAIFDLNRRWKIEAPVILGEA